MAKPTILQWLDESVKSCTYDTGNKQLIFTKNDNTTFTTSLVDLIGADATFVDGVYFNSGTKFLTLTRQNASNITVDISSLGRTVIAGGNTLDAGEDLEIQGGTNISISESDGVVTITNDYSHPASHSATMIDTDADHMFVTSDDKLRWDAKPDSDTIYTHPASHPASMITEDTTHRFVTDAERSSWNTKATTSYVDTQIANLVDSSPGTLDTLNELAQALGDDPNFASTMTSELGNKSNVGHTHSLGDLTEWRTTVTVSTNVYTTTISYAVSGLENVVMCGGVVLEEGIHYSLSNNGGKFQITFAGWQPPVDWEIRMTSRSTTVS